MSPAKYRGQLVTWSDIGINTGVVLGFAVGWLLADAGLSDGWRQMCLLGTIFPVVMILLVVSVLPETPRWSVLNGLDDEAREVLLDIYPKGMLLLFIARWAVHFTV